MVNLLCHAAFLLSMCLLSCALPESVQASLSAGNGTQLPTNVLHAADAIYAGKAQDINVVSSGTLSLNGGARLEGSWKLATFSVDHVIKGRAAEIVVVKFFVPNMAKALRSVFLEAVPKQKRCMVFLTADGEGGGYALLDAAPVIFLAQEPPSSVRTEEDTEIDGLRSELLAAAKSGNLPIALQAIKMLPQLGLAADQNTRNVLEKLSSHVESDIAGAALAVRVHSGDTHAISEAVRFAESEVCSVGQRMAIAAALRDSTSAVCVSQLINVMKSENVQLRRAASYALRHSQMDSASIMPLLAGYLGDADLEVQYNALMGMAMIEGAVGELAPSYTEFCKAPQRYVSKWEDWWSRNRARFGSPKQE